MLKTWSLWCLMSLLLAVSARAAIPPMGDNPMNGSAAKAQLHVYLLNLETELNAADDDTQKYDALGRALDKIALLRDLAVPERAEDEGYIELVVTGLESLPAQRDFSRKNCARYKSDYLNQFEPVADEAPSEPAVQPGWNVLQALCRDGG